MILYEIKHTDSGMRYVGLTTRPAKIRWKEHTYSLRKGNHHNRYLQSAWTKYGENHFEFNIINELNTAEELSNAEIEYIRNNKNLYNLSEGGSVHQHEMATKRIIGSSAKIPVIGMDIKNGEIKRYDSAADSKKDGFTPASVRKCALSSANKRKDGTTFASISHRGWVWMEEKEYDQVVLKKKSIVAKRAKIRKERPVVGMNVLDKTILRFVSASEAGRQGFSGQTVYKSCNLESSAHKGFVWSYDDIPSSQSLLEDKRSRVLSRVIKNYKHSMGVK